VDTTGAEELRGWVAKGLKLPAVPDAIWEFLEEGGYIADAYDAEGRACLLREARRGFRLWRERDNRAAPPGRVRGRDVSVELSPYEGERAVTFSEYLAILAAREPAVRRFREEVHGTRLLTPDEAFRLLSSPAAGRLSPAQFAEWGIPIVGHTSRLIKQQQEREGDAVMVRVMVQIEPPGAAFEVQRVYSVEGEDDAAHPDGHLLAHRGEDGWVWRERVWPRSVLGELRELSRRLTEHYQWAEECVPSFVLTSSIPIVSPLKVSAQFADRMYFSRSTITLTIEPWVSANTVLRAYRDVQRQVLGRDNRPLSRRNLAVFRFVNDRLDERGNTPPLRLLLDEWNRNHPEWRYADVRNFGRDLGRAERGLLLPPGLFPITEHERRPSLEMAGSRSVPSGSAPKSP
jgi:hypothetical protein